MKTQNNNTASIWRAVCLPVLIGSGGGALLCVLLLLVVAAIMTAADIPPVTAVPLSMSAAAIGALVGGILSARLSRQKGLLFGLAAGALLFFLLFCLGLLLPPQTGGTPLWIKALLLCASGASGGVIGVNAGRR